MAHQDDRYHFTNDATSACRYEFMYKQAVETQDVFLGMGEKDPSSAQCEDMLLRIELPGTALYLPTQLEQPIVLQ